MGKSNVVIDVSELKKLKSKLESLDTKKLIEGIVKKVASRHKATIIKNTPVDTGALRRSWNVEIRENPQGYLVTINTDLEYALYVENGHRVMRNEEQIGFVKGQFFIKRSEINTKGKIDKIVNTELRKVLKGVFE